MGVIPYGFVFTYHVGADALDRPFYISFLFYVINTSRRGRPPGRPVFIIKDYRSVILRAMPEESLHSQYYKNYNFCTAAVQRSFGSLTFAQDDNTRLCLSQRYDVGIVPYGFVFTYPVGAGGLDRPFCHR